MRGSNGNFDLALSYPQWQGSGRSANLPRGAEAAAAVCGRYAPLAQVPLADHAIEGFGINGWSAIFEQFRCAQAILESIKPRRILTAGGDCSVDVAIIDYLHRLYPDLTVLWVDAHLDANTPDTTPSGSFHGMPVAAIMGSAPAEMRTWLGPPLAASRLLYVSASVGDDGEWAFQRRTGLRWWEPGHPLTGPIHIHFDLDALDPAEFPYVAYPDGGMRMADGLEVVHAAAGGGHLVGLSITEFAPRDQAEATAGSGFLHRLCQVAHTIGDMEGAQDRLPPP